MARISYVNPTELEDRDLREALQHAMFRSTPRPEIQAVRAHQPDVLRAFISTWDRITHLADEDATTCVPG
jgi:hypothetical protein